MTGSSARSESDANLLETLALAGSSGLSMLLGLARTKILALTWGPEGVGALGLLQSAMATATLVTGLGVDAVVTRDLASSSEGAERGRTRDAALGGVLILALLGAVATTGVYFAFYTRLGFASNSQLLVVALGAMLGVVAANQRAVLSGLRLVRAVAISAVAGAAVATAAVLLLAQFPASALVWAMCAVVVPLGQVVVFWLALRKVPRVDGFIGWGPALSQALRLARRASWMAVAGVLPVLSQLLVRSVANGGLDQIQFGCFQAGLSLATLSVSLLASSIGPSVLPRLSAAAEDPERLSRTISEQISVYLVLYAPVMLAMEAFPDLVVKMLFADSFSPAGQQLKWQLVGELLRLPCWVMATSLTARSRFRAYLMVEAVSLLSSVGLVALAVPQQSLTLLGMGLSVSTLLQFLLLVLLLRMDGVSLAFSTFRNVGGVTALAGVAASLGDGYPTIRVGMALAAVASGGVALRAIAKLRR